MKEESINIKLVFKDSRSDKVYLVELVEKTTGWIVNFAYGRRGGPLTTGSKTKEPIEYDKAVKVYTKLINSKTAKGYIKEGGVITNIQTVDEKIPTGFLPQLLNELDEDKIHLFLMDPGYCAQEKFDGRRKIIKKEGTDLIGINKKGFEVPLTFNCLAELSFIPVDFLIDGEDMGDKVMIFDNLIPSYLNQDYRLRMENLKMILSDRNLDGCVEIVPTAWTEKEKREMYKRLKSERAEGIVFKRIDSPYEPGRPSSGGPQLKCKFYETASCIVSSVHSEKSSISIEALDDQGAPVPIGNVTVYPNQTRPAVGDIVEVKYLYYFPKGSLYQPVLLSVRDDVDTNECLLSKLKLKKS